MNSNQSHYENFNELSGCNAIGFQEENYVVRLNIDKKHLNVMGYVHGGVICTLLDTAMARSYLRISDDKQAKGATLEMKVNFLKTSSKGELIAFGKLVNKTRRTAYVEGFIESETGELIAKASATVMLLNPRNA